MAADISLRLTTSTGTYTFTTDDEPSITQERFFKAASDPLELERLVESWEFEACRITGTSLEDTIDNWQAFTALTDTRTGTRITAAALLRGAVVERTLGPSAYQEFRIESVDYATDPVPEFEAGRWRSIVPVSLVMSAARVFADSDSIVVWEQSITNTWKDGLHRQEMRTHVETAEGTNAATVAESTAVIDIASLGNRYTWVTNSGSGDGGGCEITLLDADDNNSRTPTSVDAVSVVEAWGVTVGTPSAGNAVNGPLIYSIETKTTGSETEQIYRAEAHGPGALAWVQSKAPSPPWKESSVIDGQATRVATGMWTKGEQTQSDPAKRRTVEMTLTGGYQDEEYVLISGYFPPRLSVGPKTAFILTVTIKSTFVGSSPALSDMPFPPVLAGAVWRLQRNLSREDPLPKLIKLGADETANEWERGARLVYFASGVEDITVDQLKKLVPAYGGGGVEVPSYYF